MYDLEVVNNYPFRISVGRILVLDSGKEDVWNMGTVDAHSSRLFKATLPTGSPEYHIQIKDNKILEDIRCNGDVVRSSLQDNRWHISTRTH